MKMLSRPMGVAFLLWSLAVELVLCESGAHVGDNTKNCKLFIESPSERKVLSRLEPLTNNNFTVQTKDGDDSYTYMFQICGDAGGIQGAGVIQLDKSQKPTIVGRYNSTQAWGGSDWVMLRYRHGDPYDSHCNKQNRTAIVMISCNREMDKSKLEMVLEDRERTGEDCFYMFELDSSAVCPPLPSQGLSIGSILLIIGVCLLAVYLIGGFLYQRLIVGAKGMEQFPNYAFWVEVGNMAADGCDFVCRSRSREGAPTYRGVATEPLEDEPEERDDHLLPM